MTKLEKYLKNSKKLVDKALDKYLPPEGTEPKVIHKAMRYSVFSGGKRIRPIIVLEACKACKVPGVSRDALVMGCAVELIHAYSLIHDDLPSMDDDDYRRGKPTSHRVFGEANAILSGDALLTLAFNILSNHLKANTGIKAVKELSEAIGTYGMVGGQALDIGSKGKAAGGTPRNYINKLKTARLFEASAKLGAIASGRAGGAADKKVKAMAIFGKSMGMAFQIIDDIMDDESRSETFNKRKARRDAEDITNNAKNALAIFGSKADKLKEIADYLLKRRG